MKPDTRPGLDMRRLVRLTTTALDRCQLDLSGLTVLTEAATGAYAVTPVLAALAGADVYALAARTPYGSSDEIRQATAELARLAGVADRIHLVPNKKAVDIGEADIVTNSGQVRPIDRKMVSRMKPSAVVPLMYESWEYRPTDVDLDACKSRGIVVAGTNERHPDVEVFSFLGQMALKQLHDAGIAVRGSQILLLCDNDFGSYIVRDLESAGASVSTCQSLETDEIPVDCDAVIVALRPGDEPVLAAGSSGLLNDKAAGAVLVQYWGDVDRDELAGAGVPVWPPRAPSTGHMGILPSALGPEPVVRLQAGGLKVGQLLANGLHQASPEDRSLVQLL